jgi:iron complex outermembrane receptor protein
MFKRTKISNCALLALGGALLVTTSAALAQDQRIEVTGSRIKRIDAETANPVLVISRQEIERTGETTINGVLQSIPGAGAGLDDRFTNGFAPGGGSLNLRNLGFNSTLVLVNGRRLPTYPFAQQAGTAQGFQDLNSIPLSAVDRIEILKDGASAVYGADAVAGVVNILLRQDYRGLELGASYGVSSHSDTKSPSANLTWGTGELGKDRFNLLVGANFSQRDELPSANRDYGRSEDLRSRGGADRRSSYGMPGTITDTVTGDKLYDVGGICGPSTQQGGNSIRAGFCRYDRAQLGDALPETKKAGIYSRLSFAINNDTTAFAEVLLTKNQFKSTGWPAGTTDDIGLGTNIIPAGAPNNPFPNDSDIRYRFTDVGNRGDDGSNKTKRLLLGIKGAAAGWDYEAAANFNRVDIDTLATKNALNTHLLCLMDPANAARYAAGLASTTTGQTLAQIFSATPQYIPYIQGELAKCGAAFAQYGYYNFINPAANAPGTAAFLAHDSVRTGRSQLDGFDAKATRDLMPMAGGNLGLALGFETRTEKVSDVPDIQLQTGDTLAISAAQAFGDRRISAVYAELNAPFTKELEANFALRYDKYSGNGSFSATTPKLGLRWQPNKQFLLRGTVSQAFRAPSLFETSPAQQTSFAFGIQDPVKCPVFDANIPDCVLDVRRVQQGNPDLKAEKSNVYTAGFIWELAEPFSIALDYWKVKRKDEIGSFADQTLVNAFANNPAIVVRNAAGQITQINQVPVQLNKTDTNGVDVEFNLRTGLGTLGRLESKVAVSYVDSYMFTTIDDTGAQVLAQYNGTYNQPRARASWDNVVTSGPWEYSLGGWSIGKYDGQGSTVKVGVTEIWNLGVAYNGVKNMRLRFAVNNLFDKTPRFDDESNGAQAGYNVQLSEVVGRYYTMSLNYKFY